MDITLVVSAVALSVDVSITNEWAEPLYLANYNFDYYELLGDRKYAYSRNAFAIPTQSLAYASIEGETLELLQGDGPPPPPDVQMIAPRVALYTRLLPGETVTEKIHVPQPICEWNAYNEPEVEGAKEVEVSRISLTVEYFRHSVTKRVSPHPTYRDVFEVLGYPSENLKADAVLPKRLKAYKRPKAAKRVPLY